MHHDLPLLSTLCGALVAALALGLVAHRLGLSPVVGYLLAGVVVGPATPGFVASAELAEQLAEIGVILLLFGVGLHFQLGHLLAVWRVVLPGAAIEIAMSAALGCGLAWVFGWPLGTGATFGLCIAVASTVVLTRQLADRGQQHTALGHLALGWLLTEDLVTVLLLVLLPVAAGGQGSITAVASAGAVALAKLAALMLLTVGLGRRLIPALLAYVARTRSRELFTLSVLALALGVAVGAAKLFGASMALGAFLAGMVVGTSTYAARAAADALPMRDAFAVLFFVSVGMLLDPRAVLRQAPLVVATLAIILALRPLAEAVAIRLLGQSWSVALRMAGLLAQIGEFSFVLAAAGRQLGLLDADSSAVLALASVVAIAANPWVSARCCALADRLAARERALPAEPPTAEAGQASAVVVGHGPVGQALVRALVAAGVQPVIVELNPDTVTRLQQSGLHAVYGDAAQPGLLEHAGIAEAEALFFTADVPPSAEAIARAKELNPRLRVMARARYASDVATLKAAGAHLVVAGEVEVALANTVHLLTALG